MSTPTPIPTLPITSATAAQSAHIASLTTQLHQLVDKNSTITFKLEQALRDGRERVEEEVRRGDDIVRQLRLAHQNEVNVIKERMETLRIAAAHAQESIAYAHQVTKTDLALTEKALAHQKRQYALQSAALARAIGAERILHSRFSTAKISHAIQRQALLTQLEQSRAEALATQSCSAINDDKLVSKLKNQLASLQFSFSTSQFKIAELEIANTKMAADLLASQTAMEKSRPDFKEERGKRKEVERELEEVKQQLASKNTHETQDADRVQQYKRRVRDLEVALAAEQRRVEQLVVEKGALVVEKELEKEKSALEKEKQLERQKEKESASSSVLKTTATAKKDAPVKEATKSKKRPREEDDVVEVDGKRFGGGPVIQGAFGIPATTKTPGELGKKRKKPKLDEEHEQVKSKPPKPVKSTSTNINTTVAPSKPKKFTAPAPSSPPAPSSSPISTPHFSDEGDDDDAPVPSKVEKKKPTAAAAESTTTATKKKFKAPPRDTGEKDAVAGGDSDSSDFARKRAKFFGGVAEAGKKKPVTSKEKEKDGEVEAVSSELVKNTKPKDKETVKGMEKKGKGKPKGNKITQKDEEDVFDLDAVSDTSDGSDDDELPVKVKSTPLAKATANKSEPQRKRPAPNNAPKAPPYTDASKLTRKSTTTKKMAEVENAPVAVTKPKKRTLNLNLGAALSGVGVGLNTFGAWGAGSNENRYNIPSQLSSPERGSGTVPRAKFEFGKGH